MKHAPFALLLTTFVAACAVGPDYHPKSAKQLGVPEDWSVPANRQAEDLTRWWGRFGDPVLTGLVDQAAGANLDLAQAVARVRQAREALVVSRSSLFPAIGASGAYNRSDPLRGGTVVTLPDGTLAGASGNTTSFALGLDASYQFDLFGGVRRSVESARAQYEGARLDYATVLISVEGEVARNYVLARAAQAALENARASLAIQDDNLEIAGYRVRAGLVSSLDEEQARASRAQTAASIPPIEQQYNAAVSRIGVLIGQAPGAVKPLLETPRPIPAGPEAIGVGLPADIIRQRPDVRSAERALAAATAQIGVAKAQLYPQLTVSGSLDTTSSNAGNLFETITGGLFAGISQVVFDAGKGGAQVRSARAGADLAFAAYRKAVLTALEDAENAITALRAAEARERYFATAYDAATNSALMARAQYRTGLTDFTTLNTQEAALVSARDGLVQARSDKATALIALYAALGGGWDAGAASVPGTSAPSSNAGMP